jgi:hypothetical protein
MIDWVAVAFGSTMTAIFLAVIAGIKVLVTAYHRGLRSTAPKAVHL